MLAFRDFILPLSHGVTEPFELRQRLQLVGEKLVALREYLETLNGQ